MNRRTPWVTAAAVLLSLPAAAGAGTVSQVSTTSRPLTQFRADPGEANDLRLDYSQPLYFFQDAGALLRAGKGCATLAGGVHCPLLGPVDAQLRDNNDHARVFSQAGAVTVAGGAGDDDVGAVSTSTAEARGDAGNDRVQASADGAATADGGAGNDRVNAHPWYGNATVIGGTGDDVVSLTTPQRHQDAALDGGKGHDVVVASASAGESTTVEGGDGDDLVAVHRPDDWQYRGNPITLNAGAGDDTVFGGPGVDTVDAGDGRDVIDVQGGEADTVTCGEGMDVVRHDATDTLADDCEVKLGPARFAY